MKKIVLSALAALTLGSVSASASDVKLYQDENGQVFTKPAPGRTLLEAPKGKTSWFTHADKLKFSSLAYLGYTFNDFKSDDARVDYKHDKSNFEIRRGYFQVKAYLLDDPKSYYRITFDVHQNAHDDLVVRTKYAYLYINAILPSTGVELGLVHRPWHDYEEHNAWYYRSIFKVFTEDSNAAHLSNSADFGVNFKTKTKYFDSEIGVFNGEGYHSDFNDDVGDDAGKGMSVEWRATAHLLGVNGKDKQTEKTYLDLSFFGQYNMKHKADGLNADGSVRYSDLVFGGIHTVFNMPSFLLSAQYLKSKDTAENGTYVSAQAGSGYSINTEVRFGSEKEFRVLGRYDSWTPQKLLSSNEKEQKAYLGGFAWDQNKNVQWVANAVVTDNERGSSREKYNGIAYMVTAEVKF